MREVDIKRILQKEIHTIGLSCLVMGGTLCYAARGGGKIIQHKEIDFAQSIIGIFYANWFLSVLFIFSILAAVIYRYARKCPNFCWGVLILAFYAIPSIWYIGNCKWLLPFFVIAIQFSYYDWSDVKLSLLTPSVYVFAVCYIMFVKDHSLVSVKDFECTLPYHLNIIVRTLAGTAGSVLAICMAKIVYRCGCNKLCKYIEKLGSMSLPIYVVHTQICDLNQVIDFRFGSIFIVFFIAVLLILISICFYNICSCCSHLKLFLFGENLTR